MSFTEFLFKLMICFFAGAGAGLGTGFAGMSAAAIVGPLLLTFCGVPAYQAIGIGLASDVLASAVSAYTYKKHGNLDVKNSLVLLSCVLSMTIFGSFIASFLPDQTMGYMSQFGLLVIGIKFLLKPEKKVGRFEDQSKKKRIIKSVIGGIFVGFICGFVGAGGGMMLLFVLVSFLGYEMHKAVGTSVFIMAFTALIGGGSHFYIGGMPDTLCLVLCVIFTLIWARIAAVIANRASEKTLSRMAGGIMVITSIVVLAFNFLVQGMDVKDEGNNEYSCEYDGDVRKYLEYAPEGEAKGIIFMLHGYGNAAESFRTETKLDEAANERGYVVVYVNGMANDNDKTSATGWNSGIGNSNRDDLGFLKTLASYMQDKYKLTREQTFAAGFSNGGFMMYRIAVEGKDCFAGVASVAGMMPEAMWDIKSEASDVSILQINGTKDDVVPMNSNGSAKYSKAPAIEDVMDYFATANSLTDMKKEKLSEKSELIKRYSEDAGTKSKQVWQVLIENGRHSWPEEASCGFNVNALILDFFDELAD